MIMPISIRLAVRQWLARPLRPVLCSLAIAVSVALIICVGAAMDSLRYTIVHAVGQAQGVSELPSRPPQRVTDPLVLQKPLDQFRSLPEVELVAARLLSRAPLANPAPA